MVDRRHRRFDYEGGPAEVALEVLPGGADPLGVVCREIERHLNLPFPDEPRENPFRFFAVTSADAFHLGLAYDHFIAGGESIALLLDAIAEACAGATSPGPVRRGPRLSCIRAPTAGSSCVTRWRPPKACSTSRSSLRRRAARSVRGTGWKTALTTGSPTSASIPTSSPRSAAPARRGV